MAVKTNVGDRTITTDMAWLFLKTPKSVVAADKSGRPVVSSEPVGEGLTIVIRENALGFLPEDLNHVASILTDAYEARRPSLPGEYRCHSGKGYCWVCGGSKT